MNRNILKLQKIKEANQSLENRYLLREQPAPPPPPAPAGAAPPPAVPPAPAASTPPPPSSSNAPKKLTPEQEKDLKDRLKQVESCSLDKETKEPKEGPYYYEGEKFFYRKGNPTQYTKDFWCKKEN